MEHAERLAATPEEAAYVFLERASQELRRKGALVPLAVLVHRTDQGQAYDLWTLVFTEETKHAAFDTVVADAKEKSARAIITVTDATYGRVEDAQPCRDCVFVTVSGPGIETVIQRLSYFKTRWLKRIRFGELQRTTQLDGPAFLPGWPE